MLDVACIAFVLSYLLVVWLRTNAFAEYVQLFHMTRFFHVADYLRVQHDGYTGNYVDFLAEYYHESFFVRLLVCPVCLSFWLGVSSVSFIGLLHGLCVAPVVLFFYLLFNKLL